MQVERKVNLFTMPRRRRFKPRIDCVAILGKLSSRFVTRAATHIYNPSKPPFKCASLLFVASVRQNKQVCSALTLIATLTKGDFVVSLRLTSPKVSNILSVTSSFCTISTAPYAKIKRSKIGAICKKKGAMQILRLL